MMLGEAGELRLFTTDSRYTYRESSVDKGLLPRQVSLSPSVDDPLSDPRVLLLRPDLPATAWLPCCVSGSPSFAACPEGPSTGGATFSGSLE